MYLNAISSAPPCGGTSFNLLKYRNSPDFSPSSCPLVKAFDQLPRPDSCIAVFRTPHGYRGGIILSNDNNYNHKVLFIRDERGECISQEGTVPVNCKVVPQRKHREEVSVFTSGPPVHADGYVKAGEKLDFRKGLGSGVTGQHIESKRASFNYPVYNPLSIHHSEQKKTLLNISSLLSETVRSILKNEQVDYGLDNLHWLVNVVLFVDDHIRITKAALSQALMDFCTDYRTLPKGTIIRQPINYIFDVVKVDGIYSEFSSCVSFIPTNFDGIIYRCPSSQS